MKNPIPEANMKPETTPEKPSERKPKPTAVTPTTPASGPDKPWPAWIATHGAMTAAGTLRIYTKPLMGDGPNNDDLAGELCKQVVAVNTGNMKNMEGLLVAQAHTLNAIFHRLATRSELVNSVMQYELDLKLALRAQNQCRATIETLTTLKNPPNVAFVKQANIANNQQVNNGTQASPPAAGPTPAKDSPPQLEHTHGNYLDPRTAETARRNDPAMATVGEIHRPKDRRRKS